MRLILAIRIGLQRQPNVRRRIGGKSGPQHADDGVRLARQQNGPADSSRIPRKPALPQSIADPRPLAPAKPIFLLGESPPQRHRRPKHRKITSRGPYALNLLRPLAAGDVDPRPGKIIDRAGREDVLLLPPNNKFGNRNGAPIAVRKLAYQLHDAIRIRIRKRLQQHSIDHSKNRSISPNPKPQSQYRSSRKPGRTPQSPPSEPHVLHQILKKVSARHVVTLLQPHWYVRLQCRHCSAVCRGGGLPPARG